MPPICTLDISGSHYEMGYQHGQVWAQAIRDLVEKRIQLSRKEQWTGRNLSRQHVLALANACLTEHDAYAPELVDYLQGISDASNVTLAELIVLNGFTDLVDAVYNLDGVPPKTAPILKECTTFLTSNQATAAGQALIGQTWDMHTSACPHVILLRAKPNNAPAYLTFTLTGCVAMIGINEAGIAVCINNISAADGQPGVTWPFVCGKILAQTTIEDALECVVSAKLAGGHNYMLVDAHGQGFMVEAMPNCYHVKSLNNEPLIHTNLCQAEETRAVQRPISPEGIQDSHARHSRAAAILKSEPVTPEIMMRLTRSREDSPYNICVIAEPPYDWETCGAVIMRPATREMWCVWGLPTENDYQRFVI